MNILTRLPRTRKSRALTAGVAVAVLGGAAFGGFASAASASPAASSGTAAPAVAAPCTTAQLRVWLGVPGDGSAGHVAYPLEISNVSNHTCTLYGYPGVSAVGAGGKQLGSAASRDAAVAKRTVTLTPGATSYSGLLITDTGVYSKSQCDPVTAIGLRVYPPNTTVYQIIDFPFTACAKAGPNFLSVRTVVAGVGIPLHSV